MVRITVDNNQSIWDIAIQYYGSVDGVQQLMIDNPTTINFNDPIVPGTKLIIRDEFVKNKPIVDYFTKKGLNLATAVSVPSAGGYGDYSNDYNNDYST